jgi:hypothetical protein
MTTVPGRRKLAGERGEKSETKNSEMCRDRVESVCYKMDPVSFGTSVERRE